MMRFVMSKDPGDSNEYLHRVNDDNSLSIATFRDIHKFANEKVSEVRRRIMQLPILESIEQDESVDCVNVIEVIKIFREVLKITE